MEPCMEGLVDYVRRQVRLHICHIQYYIFLYILIFVSEEQAINHNHSKCISQWLEA